MDSPPHLNCKITKPHHLSQDLPVWWSDNDWCRMCGGVDGSVWGTGDTGYNRRSSVSL